MKSLLPSRICPRPRLDSLRPRGAALILSLALTACSAVPTATPSGELQGTTTAACVENEQGTACLPVAESADRVDLAPPSFSEPTRVDNPLHPSGLVSSALYLGSVGGEPFRSEVTLLPSTKIIEWDGRQIEVLQSQYFAYLDGRIHEVAIDWYAQADDGSVWYFGEDVFNYEDGALADTAGTWLAGRDGPAAMIMPARPAVGQVYRPENIPGLVFEEVTVQSTDVTVAGPSGPVPGSILVRELHMDGSTEDKTFAPGYGEFSTGDAVDLEAMALAVPTDALSDPMPTGLAALLQGSERIFDSASQGDVESAEATLADLTAAWQGLRGTGVPPRLEDQMTEALGSLETAVAARTAADIQQASLGVARSALDLQLRYRSPAKIDLGRFALILRQLGLDSAAGETGAVAGDVITLKWILDRFGPSLAASEADSIEGQMRELETAAENEDLAAAADTAARLHEIVSPLLLEL